MQVPGENETIKTSLIKKRQKRQVQYDCHETHTHEHWKWWHVIFCDENERNTAEMLKETKL